MRLLERNKRYIWFSNYLGQEEVVEDGKYTGEFVFKYSSPYKIKVNFMPISNYIKKYDFGDASSVSMVIITDKDIFKEDTVFFEQEPDPNDDFSSTYDYKVVKIVETLNTYSIGIKKRVK